MAMSVNKVTVAGRLSNDIIITHTAKGIPIASFNIAINRYYKGVNKAVFVPIKVWGKAAETLTEHFEKGDPIYIDGKLNVEDWNYQGRKYTKMVVTAKKFEFCGMTKKNRGEHVPSEQEDENEPF